ncbi:MAG: sigma-70 family RNA polymerase sigma factor [Thermomicrobiales bacterium]|nr:sigma-70 family RNA polymerase sigma factor [Thermomicrobiales bacterium]MCO5222679.1 sigma-70 family RNA polymerase sigma factor [Thermomicrobiales bacterium]
MGAMTVPFAGDRDQQEELDAVHIRAAQQDPTAFAPLYEAYVDAIYGYCWRLLRDSNAAADATSETFTKALKALPTYRSKSFRSWLFTIAHRVVIDMARRQRPTVPLDAAGEMHDPGATPEEHYLTGESDDRVVQLLAQLSPLQRDVIALRIAGLTGKEIAAVLGRRHGAIRMAQYRALERLRQLLDESTNATKESPSGRV